MLRQAQHDINWLESLEEAQRLARESDRLVLIDVFGPT
jgi:hypothetical protein